MKTNWRMAPRGDVGANGAGIYVSLNPKGKFVIGRKGFERLGGPGAVNILYDPPNNRLGLKPAAKATRDAYPVGRLSKDGRRAVYGFRALQEFGIRLPETVRFYDADIDHDGILVLDLRTARVPPMVTNHPTRKKGTHVGSVSTGNRSDGSI
jgi:hypothetical protein